MPKHRCGGFLAHPPTFLHRDTFRPKCRKKGIALQSPFPLRLLLENVVHLTFRLDYNMFLSLIGFVLVVGKQIIDRHKYWTSRFNTE